MSASLRRTDDGAPQVVRMHELQHPDRALSPAASTCLRVPQYRRLRLGEGAESARAVQGYRCGRVPDGEPPSPSDGQGVVALVKSLRPARRGGEGYIATLGATSSLANEPTVLTG